MGASAAMWKIKPPTVVLAFIWTLVWVLTASLWIQLPTNAPCKKLFCLFTCSKLNHVLFQNMFKECTHNILETTAQIFTPFLWETQILFLGSWPRSSHCGYSGNGLADGISFSPSLSLCSCPPPFTPSLFLSLSPSLCFSNF